MSKFTDKGYHVRENAPAYFSLDLERTTKWFEDTLGWYSNIARRDEGGRAVYGVVYEILPEVELSHLAPFTGLHLFYGEPRTGLVSFMQVTDVEALHDFVIRSGWTEITEIERLPWGKRCTLTTIDGSTIDIFG